MVFYRCKRCGWNTHIRTHFRNHLNRKRICKPLISNRSIEELKLEFNKNIRKDKKEDKKVTHFDSSETPNDPSETPNDPSETHFDPKMTHFDSSETPNDPKYKKCKKYICKYCKREYSKNCHMHRHMKNCKFRNIDMSLSKETLLKYIDIIKNDREELKRQIEELMLQVSGGNTINNGNNNRITQNNNSHNVNKNNNNNNKIYINNFGNENHDYITGDYLTNLLKIPYSAIQKLIKTIHFNPKHPENHNVKIPNRKEKFALVYNNGNWDFKNKHDVIGNMVDNGYNMLDCHFDDEGKLVLEDVKRKRFIHFQEDFEDDKCRKRLEEDTEILMLNKLDSKESIKIEDN